MSADEYIGCQVFRCQVGRCGWVHRMLRRWFRCAWLKGSQATQPTAMGTSSLAMMWREGGI